MPKKAGIVFVIAGAVLIASALLLLFYNAKESERAGEQAEALLENIRSVIPEYTEEAQPDLADEAEMAQSSELTVVEIDGYDYVGYLSIPVLGVELPVMSDWDYTRLEIAACRQFGSSKMDDLVIAAHNYKTHFGRLSALNINDSVTFTDMEGEVNSYVVVKNETLPPTAVAEVQNSGYDLVLYTCTYGGATRTAVFCNRTDGEA